VHGSTLSRFSDCSLQAHQQPEKKSNSSASHHQNTNFEITDPRLGAAIVDRLTFNGTIIETGTDSYRLAHTLAHQTGPARGGFPAQRQLAAISALAEKKHPARERRNNV
jgi:hypothetical protein